MAFRGWPVEALEFYEGLSIENTKAWWQANKTTYDECVHAPMASLLAELEPEFGAGKIFRPYRDVRFSKDKTPYKTHIGAILDGGGYIQLSAEGLGTGSGFYHPESARLRRFRDAVADDATGVELERIVAAVRKSGADVGGHNLLTRVPTGYDKEHPRAELLRHKDLVAWRQWPVAAWLGTAKAKTKVVEFLRACQPLNDWLAKNVGGEQ